MAKKDRGQAMNLDAFLDIMTCLVGVLVLIIIQTGLDASQIKVIEPTPMGHLVDKKAVWIECRGNQLYLVPKSELQKQADERLGELAEKAKGNNEELLNLLRSEKVTSEFYEVDLAYMLFGQSAIRPLPDKEGFFDRKSHRCGLRLLVR